MRDVRFDLVGFPQAAPAEALASAVSDARTLARGPASLAALDAALAEVAPSVWRCYHAAFVEAAGAPAAREGWAAALESAIATETAALPAALLAGESIAALAQDWQLTSDPRAVWRHVPTASLMRRELGHHSELLLLIWPERGLSAVERLPYPGLMQEVFALACSDDRAMIGRVLRHAGPVFDSGGAWVGERNVAALFATELILEHARGLEQCVAQVARAGDGDREARAVALEVLRSRELPEWMSEGFRVLLERADGLEIGISYAAHLARELLIQGRSSPLPGRWYAEEPALTALINCLSDARVSLSDIRGVAGRVHTLGVEAAERHANTVRVTRAEPDPIPGREGGVELSGEMLPFLLVATQFPSICAGEAAGLLRWLDELLVGRDPGLSLISGEGQMCRTAQHLGRVLSRLDGVCRALPDLYLRLEPQRRRAGHVLTDHDPILPSLVLLRIAVSVAAHLSLSPPEEETARALYRWAFERLRRLWLTVPIAHDDVAGALAGSAGAAAVVFKSALALGLKTVLPHLAGDPQLLGFACVNLTLNGVAAGTIAEAAAELGIDLRGALHEAALWASLTRREVREELAELGRSLGLDFPLRGWAALMKEAGSPHL